MSSVFVTSSGTGLGKTYLMCRLIAELKDAGRAFRACKPLLSGFDAAAAAASDSGLILKACGQAVDDTALDAVSPWRLRAAVSPDMAAQREQRSIPFDELVAFSRPSHPTELTLVEGIGGVMVPIDAKHTVLDWMDALGAPTLLVVGSYLGSLSHSLTAAAALASRGIECLAILVSESLDAPVSVEETADSLRRFVDAVPVVTLPRPPATTDTALLPLLGDHLR